MGQSTILWPSPPQYRQRFLARRSARCSSVSLGLAVSELLVVVEAEGLDEVEGVFEDELELDVFEVD